MNGIGGDLFLIYYEAKTGTERMLMTFVAPPLAHCDDPEVTGAPFYVMDFVDGAVVKDAAAAAGLDDAARRGATESVVDTLAAIHANGLGFGELLQGLRDRQQEAYIELQHQEWAAEDLPSRSHHLFSGVPYHHVMGSVYGAARLSTSVHEEHRTEQAV